MKRILTPAVALAVAALWGASAHAADPDPATLYELSTQGSTSKLKAGEKGTFVLQIRSKEGAHVSDEAPLKLEVAGRNVKVQKSKLTLSDSVAAKPAGQKYVDPRFEIPVVAESSGKGSVDGKLTFFICTDRICARQQKSVSVPIEVL